MPSSYRVLAAGTQAYNVTGVTLGGLDAACVGQAGSLTLSGTGGRRRPQQPCGDCGDPVQQPHVVGRERTLLLGTGLVVMNTATGTSVSVRATVPSVGLGVLGATAGVVASYTNTSTFLRAQIRRGVLVGLLGDFVELTDGGSAVAAVAYTITASSTPELRITRSGATVGVRVDGTVMITHTLTGP